MATDPRTIPLALRVETPQSADTTGIVAQLKADEFGALFNSLADPITGFGLYTAFGADDLPVGDNPGDARYLATLSCMYAWDEVNSNSLRPVNSAPMSSDPALPTDPYNFVRGPTCASIVTVRDLVAETFQTVDRGLLDADALGVTRNAQLTAASLQAFNPTTVAWDRLRSYGWGETIAFDTPNEVGILTVNAGLYIADSGGTNASLAISADTAQPTVNESGGNWLRTIGAVYLHDGASFGRLGSASAPQLATQSGDQALLAAAPGEWTLTHAPIANTQATATRAAGAAGVRHVLRSINATLVGVAAIAAPISVVVRDGATGVGPILWADQLFAAAAGSKDRVTLTGLNIVGSAATAMTIEFIAAPGATNFEAVAATGYSSAAAAS